MSGDQSDQAPRETISRAKRCVFLLKVSRILGPTPDRFPFWGALVIWILTTFVITTLLVTTLLTIVSIVSFKDSKKKEKHPRVLIRVDTEMLREEPASIGIISLLMEFHRFFRPFLTFSELSQTFSLLLNVIKFFDILLPKNMDFGLMEHGRGTTSMTSKPFLLTDAKF